VRRRLIGLAVLTLLVAACTAGGGGSSKPVETIDPNANHAPMTLTVWSNFTAREYKISTAAFQLAQQKYPWLTVKHVGGKDDQALQRAISSGSPPDVLVGFTPDNAARYCSSGSWQDLNPYLSADKIDKSTVWPSGVFSYTSFQNKQSALPMMTDAKCLDYNVDINTKAGFK
jgi:multiple sugar transport system substrate-binding protein